MQLVFFHMDAEFSLDQVECLSATIAWFVIVTFLFYVMASAFFNNKGKISTKRILGNILIILIIILISRPAQKMGASFFAYYLFLLDIAYPFGRAPLWPIIPSIVIGSALGVLVTRKKFRIKKYSS